MSEAAAPVRTAAQNGNWTPDQLENCGAGDECGGVGADAEEGDVSEVEEAGEADDDVEAEGDGGDDEDVHAEVGVVLVVLDEGEGDRRRGSRRGGDDPLLRVMAENRRRVRRCRGPRSRSRRRSGSR